MKRFTALLAAMTLTFSLAAAQGAPDDVPTGHWAYQAVDGLMRMGLLKGYPDGKFRGDRALTRYEFAQALYDAVEYLRRQIDDLNTRVNNIRTGGEPQTGQVSRADIENLQNQINALKALEGRLKTVEDAVATIQRLAPTFQQELASLGVDVDALKREQAALAARVKALEEKKEKFQWWGDLSFVAYHPHSIDDKDAVTLNGALTGRKVQMFHELGLGINVQANEEVSGSALFTVGNYLSYLGNVSTVPAAYNANNNSPTTITLWEAYVNGSIDFFGNDFNFTVGRVPVKLTKFTLMRTDPDWYVELPRYDDGAFRIDGARGDFDFGSVNLNWFLGKVDTVQSDQTQFMQFGAGVPATPVGKRIGLESGPVAVTKLAAIQGAVDILRGEGTNANLGVSYGTYRGGFNAVAPNGDPYYRIDVLGANVNGKFADRFMFGVEWAQSMLYQGDNRISGLDEESWALDANLGYDFSDALKLGVGYREVRPFFAAPGAWGRIGNWYNPHDLKGFYAGINYKPNDDWGVMVKGEFYEGSDRVAGGLTSDDEVNRVLAGIMYRFSDRWDVQFNYEGVFWRARSAALGGTNGDPRENYFTVGVGYNMGENTMLRLLYQVIDYDDDGLAAFSAVTPGGEDRAGVASATLSIKF